jgi:DNA-binding NarL/FixJ family response regulator
MGKYILADNQELTQFALESLLCHHDETVVGKATDKTGLVELLKEHEDAVVLLDYTLFDFADDDQLLILAERFSL